MEYTLSESHQLKIRTLTASEQEQYAKIGFGNWQYRIEAPSVVTAEAMVSAFQHFDIAAALGSHEKKKCVFLRSADVKQWDSGLIPMLEYIMSYAAQYPALTGAALFQTAIGMRPEKSQEGSTAELRIVDVMRQLKGGNPPSR